MTYKCRRVPDGTQMHTSMTETRESNRILAGPAGGRMGGASCFGLWRARVKPERPPLWLARVSAAVLTHMPLCAKRGALSIRVLACCRTHCGWDAQRGQRSLAPFKFASRDTLTLWRICSAPTQFSAAPCPSAPSRASSGVLRASRAVPPVLPAGAAAVRPFPSVRRAALAGESAPAPLARPSHP